MPESSASGLRASWRGQSRATGGGAKLWSMNLKGIVCKNLIRLEYAHPDKVGPTNKRIATLFMETGVAKILHERGTPFLYKPSRQIWAMGTKNNQETVWVQALDSENFDPFRSGMTGCFRCPVTCRPMNDVTKMYPE